MGLLNGSAFPQGGAMILIGTFNNGQDEDFTKHGSALLHPVYIVAACKKASFRDTCVPGISALLNSPQKFSFPAPKRESWHSEGNNTNEE